jgi:hypothetical protein
MRTFLILAIAAATLTAPVTASLIEDQTGFHYQDDGGAELDAPDQCELPQPLRAIEFNAQAKSGKLVPGDDEKDYYQLNSSASLVGVRVQVLLRAADANLANLSLDVELPGCGGSVFDPATYEQQKQALESDPKYSPTEPAAEGEKTVFAQTLTGYACDSTQWHFLINKIGGRPAPDHIRVQWSDGDIENIPSDQQTPATLAHYRTTSHLDTPVWSAAVNIVQDWHGKFNLGSGPCVGEPTPPHEVFSPPFVQGAHGEFTIVYGEPYAMAAIYQPPKAPSTTVAVSCHELCNPAFDAMGLSFGYDAQAIVPSGSQEQ